MRSVAVAHISPGDLKKPVAPQERAKHMTHGNGVEGKFFCDEFAGDAQVQAAQCSDRHNQHHQQHNPPSNVGSAHCSLPWDGGRRVLQECGWVAQGTLWSCNNIPSTNIPAATLLAERRRPKAGSGPLSFDLLPDKLQTQLNLA